MNINDYDAENSIRALLYMGVFVGGCYIVSSLLQYMESFLNKKTGCLIFTRRRRLVGANYHGGNTHVRKFF